jgi:putative N-acetyltransferase (TIGR04045 family)
VKDVLRSRSRSADLRTCRSVEGPAELALHHRIRRLVFVEEQGLFDRDDRDERDDDPRTVHVLGLVDGLPAGTVRLYPLEPPGPVGHPRDGGLWKGDRLAVLPDQRRSGIGGPLVRFAVATATATGGSRMDATVQAGNTTFFLGLGWTAVGGPYDHLGVPHQSMTIALA